MKERPVLFTPENAQKVHIGAKTQTRRIVKDINPTFLGANPTGQQIHNAMRCPYGEVGDRFWVREAWQVDAPRDGTWPDTEFFGCKGAPLSLIHARYRKPEHCLFRGNWTGSELKWRSGMLMPRWACRTVLEITEIRVQRVQEISQADAIAEGAPPSHPSIDKISREYGYPDFPRSWFAQLWESINGPGSWDVNPWVWAITFKKV